MADVKYTRGERQNKIINNGYEQQNQGTDIRMSNIRAIEYDQMSWKQTNEVPEHG